MKFILLLLLSCQSFGSFPAKLSPLVITAPLFNSGSSGGDLSNVIDVSVGDYRSCFLSPQRASCVGSNVYSELDSVSGFRNAKQIVSGRYHNCVLDEEGVWCWGFEGFQPVPPMKNISRIVASEFTTCALTDEGVICWGVEDDSILSASPTKNVRQLESGSSFVCAIDDEALKCWGRFDFDLTRVPPPSRIRSMSTGTKHVCVLAEKLHCFGRPTPNIDATEILQLVSTQNYNLCYFDRTRNLNCTENSAIPRFDSVDKYTIGLSHGCAITAHGPKCWGSNSNGQTNLPRDFKNPNLISTGAYNTCIGDELGILCFGNLIVPPPNLPAPDQMVASLYHHCALKSGKVRCWGNNNFGESVVPEDLIDVDEIAVGSGFSCARAKNSLRCWGKIPKIKEGKNPRLLTAHRDNLCFVDGDEILCSDMPTTLSRKLRNIKKLAISADGFCVIDDGGLVCTREAPKGVDSAFDIFANSQNFCALLADGSPQIKCWGFTAVGSTPELGHIKTLSVGLDHICALTDTGPTCWGQCNGGKCHFPQAP